jgi:redox-sensitive bicupin YhaK (pirin superfamily)
LASPSFTISTEREFGKDKGFKPATPECFGRALDPHGHIDFTTFTYLLITLNVLVS